MYDMYPEDWNQAKPETDVTRELAAAAAVGSTAVETAVEVGEV